MGGRGEGGQAISSQATAEDGTLVLLKIEGEGIFAVICRMQSISIHSLYNTHAGEKRCHLSFM